MKRIFIFLCATVFFLGAAVFSMANLAATATYPPRLLNIPEAHRAFNERRNQLIQRWLDDFAADATRPGKNWQTAIGSFKNDGATRSFRRIAVGLWARKQQRWAGRQVFRNTPPNNFPALVEAWTGTITKHERAGTCGRDSTCKGDYDMIMKEMVALLYLFKNDPELTNNAAFNIIDLGLRFYMGQEFGPKMTYKVVGTITYPETENHVLMIHSSQYLTNQYILENPRRDPRLTQGRYADRRQFDNRGGRLEDILFQAAGRPLYNGFFETNGRPYQVFTFHSLLNIYNNANNPRLTTAARNALDYLSTKYAFQSLQGRRFTPNRRNNKYARRLDFLTNDGINYVMGSLSGAGTYIVPGKGNAAGHALWAMWGNYRLPESVHDYMLNKHDGYWARMQARFASNHYEAHHWPRYFQDGRAFGDPGKLESAAELYFATNDFMNVAGSNYERYKVEGDEWLKVHGAGNYDFLSVPQVIVLPGVTRDWNGLGQLQQDYPVMLGEQHHWKSTNGGTFKSFSYGYYHAGLHDRHLDWPMTVPAAWEVYRYREAGQDQWSRNRAMFKFYDFSRVSSHQAARPARVYVVMARASKSKNAYAYRHYARGWWEIVPASRFASARDLKDAVLRNNPDAHFQDATEGAGKPFRYTMTTGDRVELEDIVGHDVDRCYNPIKAIQVSGRSVSLAEYALERCNREERARMPLLEVRGIDPRTYALREVVAFARGDGRLWVSNRYTGKRLELDSSDYRNPRRVEREIR